MKIEPKQNRAFASLVVLLLLAMMVGIVMANSGALFHLQREIKNTERRQQLRWKHLTNAPAAKEVKK